MFKIIADLSKTGSELYKKIQETTKCGPGGPQGPSNGDHALIAATMEEAREKNIKFNEDHPLRQITLSQDFTYIPSSGERIGFEKMPMIDPDWSTGL